MPSFYEEAHVATVPLQLPEVLTVEDPVEFQLPAITQIQAHPDIGLTFANALRSIGAPREVVSPLVQHLPDLWELFHEFGMTTLELNPIRMRADAASSSVLADSHSSSACVSLWAASERSRASCPALTGPVANIVASVASSFSICAPSFWVSVSAAATRLRRR